MIDVDTFYQETPKNKLGKAQIILRTGLRIPKDHEVIGYSINDNCKEYPAAEKQTQYILALEPWK